MSLKCCVLGVALFLVVAASARPKYVAIPLLEGARILELEEPLARMPRQAPKGADEEASGSGYRFERQTGGEGHEHVDYGAHTGHHGAFGWYADFPVHGHHS